MWNGKNKAVTFSFDDGNFQDEKVITILNKYNLKGTFNLCSGLLGKPWQNSHDGKTADCTKIKPERVKDVYLGHEVASHTISHPRLTELSDSEVIRQVEEDRLYLSNLVGYDVVGFAYPNSAPNYDKRVLDLIKNKTGIKYARTVNFTWDFSKSINLFEFHPTVYQAQIDRAIALAKEFTQKSFDSPTVFSIMGHSYEADLDLLTWEKFDELCAILSNHDDIFYGTNKDILLCKK